MLIIIYKKIEINIPNLAFYIIIIMNAIRILDIFKHVFLKQNKCPSLGRWSIHNDRQTILKLKYANEDNCGISGNNSKNTTKIQKNNVLEDNPYIYMMGYESTHN